MKPGLLVNENFPVPAVRLLREAGVDVLAVGEIMPGASDVAVLNKARETGRWLVTFDRDYGELIFRRNLPAPPAVLYVRQESVPPSDPARWVLDLVLNPDVAAGHFVVVGGRTTRRRTLP